MIIRKPYAFLIKNFKKIHIFLFVLSLYVAYKLVGVSSFTSNFMKFGTYDIFSNPIGDHITFLLRFIVLLICALNVALIFLFQHKNKPWKIYLIPAIEYFVLFFVLGMIKNFFSNFTAGVKTTDLRMAHDLLFMLMFGQVPSIILFIVRFVGLDLNKFNFDIEEEFLELDEEDREEVEIGIDVDKKSFVRLLRRFKRNFGYFYLEHTKLVRFIAGLLIVLVVYRCYHFVFIYNKTYKQGQLYNVEGYTFKLNNAYYTDKDYLGNVITKQSGFIILDMTVKNKSSSRKVKLEKFHIRSGKNDFTPTREVYQKEFQDLGTVYDDIQSLKKDEEKNFILIYKVNRKKWLTKFELYYQEYSGYLRKIKFRLKDISKADKAIEYKLGEDMELNFGNIKDTISIDSFSVTDKIVYLAKWCSGIVECERSIYERESDGTHHFIKMTFTSDEIEAKKLIDFLSDYGKIEYINSKGKWTEAVFKNAIGNRASGKELYLSVPLDVSKERKIRLKITVRNKVYYYQLN